MKKILLVVLFAVSIHCNSQYLMTGNDGDVVYTSTGDLYLGPYIPGSLYTVTICSDDMLCSRISLTFNAWTTGSGNFCVYDGVNTSAPLIGCNAWGVTQSVQASPTNETGCLTLQFSSPVAGSNIGGVIGCDFQCQSVAANVYTSEPGFIYYPTGYQLVTSGPVMIDFSCWGIYQNTTYTQADATSTFQWYLDNELVQTGQNFSYYFNQNDVYKVDLVVTDAQGCQNQSMIRYFITQGFTGDVSFDPPNFSNFQIGDTIDLLASINFQDSVDCSVPNYLADGSGVSYSFPINFDCFDSGQTLGNTDDLLGICATIEHSFLGSLEISITCPYNTAIGAPITVILEEQSGGNTFLGSPIDDAGGGGPGTGWHYCWTMPENADFMSPMGIIADDYDTLPEGNYIASESLENLVGCVLNGNWILTITDQWVFDDGYLFCWDINFANDIYTYPPVYPSQSDTSYWTGEDIINADMFSAQSVPESEGAFTYVFQVQDYYGFSHDYYITMLVDNELSRVNGMVFRDIDSDCLFETGDIPLSGRLIEFLPGPVYATTDEFGNYTAMLYEGDYQVRLVTDASDEVICPIENLYSISVGFEDTIEGIDFVTYMEPSECDLRLTLFSTTNTNPIWGNYQMLAVKNMGGTFVDNYQVKLYFTDLQEFAGSSIDPDLIEDNILTWNLTGLDVGEEQNFWAFFDVSPDFVGQYFSNNAEVTSSCSDIDTTNNEAESHTHVVLSYDPNCKSVYPFGEGESGNILETDSLFTYTIQFQNTGTDVAYNIVILDTISEFLDISTFRPLGSSHNYTWDISGTDLLTFTFADIMLPDSVTNEPESHGLVSYSIKMKDEATVGDVIENTAHIYFDFNEPVVTNTTVNTIVDSLVNVEEGQLPQITVYPNPADNYLNILPAENYSFTIYNLLGEVIFRGIGSKVDVSLLKDGVYMLRIKADIGGTRVVKFVKR